MKRGSGAAKIESRRQPGFSCQEKSNLGKIEFSHLNSILDGHFVAGNRIWEEASKIKFRWSETPI